VFGGKKIVVGILISFAIIFLGTIGYMIIEGWGFVDAFYMTVITITTVGFGEPHKLGNAGRIYTTILIMGGIGVVLYLVSMIAEFVVEGRIREVFGRRKLEKKIKTLKDHYIICGYGRVGTTICDILSSKPLNLVIIDNDPKKSELLYKKGLLHVSGEATDEDVLMAAGINNAKGLITALGRDMDNLYITLSARGINPGLFIMARSGDVGSGKKLLRAGADKVVSPYRIGARRMARILLRPTVTDFLELLRDEKNRELQLEEIPVNSASRLIGVPLRDSKIRQDLDLIVIAIKKADGRINFNPSFATTVDTDDIVIAMGESNNLIKLENILNPAK
jgi:voltage-gated potassium channel